MKRNIFKIFFNGLLIYLQNFVPLSRAMLFPVFGQALGIFLILAPVYYYRQNYLSQLTPENLEKNLIYILLGLVVMVIPGFIIFLKAFWDYMIAMVSLNTMVQDIFEKKPSTHFKTHNAAVKLRTKDYVALLFILTGIWCLLPAIPFILLIITSGVLSKIFSTIIFGLSLITCIALLFILSVYLCLCLQIFAFEAISPRQIILKSYEMIDNNFWRTLVLGFLLLLATGIIAPLVIQELVRNSVILPYIVKPFRAYTDILLENPMIIQVIAKYGLTLGNIAKETAIMTVGTITTAILLPLGSACFSLLYFDIKNTSNSEKKDVKKEPKKAKTSDS